MIQIKNLLPSDTRAAEIISGVSLFFSSILVFYGHDKFLSEHILEAHHWLFWAMIFLIFGVFQLVSVLNRWDVMIRAILCLFIGTYWIWDGFSGLCQSNFTATDILPIVLGISCQYSFVINLLYSTKNHGHNITI